jgi:type II secretion system protein J
VIKSERGFTLVELVIAVSILAIILTMAYSSLEFIIRTKKLLDDRREIGAIANAVLLRVSKELQLVTDKRLIRCKEEQRDPIIKLEGKSSSLDAGERGDSIEFMAENAGQYVPGGLSNNGTVMIRYHVEKDPDSPKDKPSSYLLIRDEVPDTRPIKVACENRMTFPIAKNVIRLEFSYYDVDKAKWNSDWENNRDLPKMIRMVLALRSPAGVEHEFVTVLPIS